MTSFNIHHASAPVFVRSLRNMPAWLDKAIAEGKPEIVTEQARKYMAIIREYQQGA